MRCLMHFVLFLLFSSNAIAQAQLLESIDVVHVVSMTHLDVGYSNTAKYVIELYMNEWYLQSFPQLII